MSCPACPQKMTYALISLVDKACGACQRQIRQMLAGFRGIVTEARPKRIVWDNTPAFNAWQAQLTDADKVNVQIKSTDDYAPMRCDIRDMKLVVGLPKFLSLEDQIYTAWMNEGVKDEKIQEVLGLTYSQLVHVKKVIRMRLRKQMAFYHQVQKTEKEDNNG